MRAGFLNHQQYDISNVSATSSLDLGSTSQTRPGFSPLIMEPYVSTSVGPSSCWMKTRASWIARGKITLKLREASHERKSWNKPTGPRFGQVTYMSFCIKTSRFPVHVQLYHFQTCTYVQHIPETHNPSTAHNIIHSTICFRPATSIKYDPIWSNQVAFPNGPVSLLLSAYSPGPLNTWQLHFRPVSQKKILRII